MDERIRELWDRAAELETDASWEGQTKFMEKFAELIIRECLIQVDKNFVGAVGTYAGTHNSAVLKCQKSIKQHFGINE